MKGHMRTKKENKGLPSRWRFAFGAYYYSVPPGREAQWGGNKLYRLGSTLPESYKTWSSKLDTTLPRHNMKGLFDRYAAEEIPLKEPKTQSEYVRYVTNLRLVFDDVAMTDIKPQDVYKYVDKRTAKVSAHREIAVLSAAFTKAVEWGYLDKHPFKGEVRLKGEKPRSRYIEDWEILECLNLSCEGGDLVAQSYMRLKLLTGMGRGDLLRLTMSDIKDDGIHITRHKTRNSSGKSTIYEWSDELREVVDAAKAARPVQLSPYLFCNRRGQSYMNEDTGEAEGWKSLWQRFMDRVFTETKVKVRFTEHDLRAKVGSDAPTLEHARALLSHTNSDITNKVYRRKAERVQPARSIC